MNSPKFIVFEGIDGCGKDTQLNLLKEHLELTGNKVKVYSNIDRGPLEKEIRDLLNPEKNLFISSFHLANLILCNMAMQYKAIKKDVDDGYYVLCSRWSMSSLAYTYNDLIISSIVNAYKMEPDVYIQIKVLPEVGLNRLLKRGGGKEMYDSIEKLVRIDDSYSRLQNIYKYLNTIDTCKYYVVDGNVNKNETHMQVLKALEIL